jgi:hypothetical protein
MAKKQTDHGLQSLGFDAATLSEVEHASLRVWGRREQPRPGPSGRDRRKAIQLYRNWSEHKPEDGPPPWSTRSLIACGCLSEHCICGCLVDPGSTISISDLGREFADRLNAPAEEFDGKLYPSAVVIGLFAQLREKLLRCVGPHFGEGRFPTGGFETIHYRLVMLPFGGGPWQGGHWMGLASWKPGGYRRLMRREG